MTIDEKLENALICVFNDMTVNLDHDKGTNLGLLIRLIALVYLTRADFWHIFTRYRICRVTLI